MGNDFILMEDSLSRHPLGLLSNTNFPNRHEEPGETLHLVAEKLSGNPSSWSA